MANKQLNTAKQVEYALKETRGLLTLTAAILGCDPDTVRNYLRRYPTLRQTQEDQRARLVDAAELRLVEAVEKKGEPWAIALVLKTIGKGRGYAERTEHTGADGKDLPTGRASVVFMLPPKGAPPDPGAPPTT